MGRRIHQATRLSHRRLESLELLCPMLRVCLAELLQTSRSILEPLDQVGGARKRTKPLQPRALLSLD